MTFHHAFTLLAECKLGTNKTFPKSYLGYDLGNVQLSESPMIRS